MLNLLYITLLVVGGILGAGALYTMRHRFMAGHQPPPGRNPVAPLLGLSLAVGLVVFGTVGLLLALTELTGGGRDVIIALGVGILAAFVTQVALYSGMAGGQSAQNGRALPEPGQEAQVVIDIPGHGVGQIVYETAAGSMTVGASSADGDSIPGGQLVTVVRSDDRLAVVSAARRGMGEEER